MKKKWFSKLTVVLSMALMLTACGSGSGEGNGKETASASSIEQEYPARIENEGDTVDGGTLKVAVVSDSGFKGIFNGFLYSDGIDDAFMKYTMDGAFPVDGDFKLIANSDETPINLSFDTEKKTLTYKINPNFKWSNGEQVTTADIAKTYEIVANQDYIIKAQSPRFDDEMKVIEGIEEYNEGKADHISGLEIIDDSNMVIHLKKLTPGLLWGGSFAGEFVNAKQLEGIPMDKITESDALRKNPLSYGPYVIKDIIQGEKVIFEANPHFYKGEPKVKNVEMEILPTSQQVAAIQAGKYDLVYMASADVFPQLEELDNIKIASRQELYMSYMGFKQGKWDSTTNTVVTDPNAKMNDVNLKKAMAYAIDNDTIGEKFYHGLRFNAPSPIAPLFKSLHDPEMTGYKYDMEKANKLLDEGGFKDVDGDGIREDKDGNPLKINFAMMSGGEVAEPLSQYYMQQWKEIGLDVTLVDGRLLELHDFYDRMQVDDPGIDVFMAAFGLASDPNPSGLYGEGAAFNYNRYTSPELQAAIDKLGSEEALDDAKREEFYHEFEKVFFNEAPSIPMQNRVEILPVNNRVKLYDWNQDDSAANFTWADIELTEAQPVVSSK